MSGRRCNSTRGVCTRQGRMSLVATSMQWRALQWNATQMIRLSLNNLAFFLQTYKNVSAQLYNEIIHTREITDVVMFFIYIINARGGA